MDVGRERGERRRGGGVAVSFTLPNGVEIRCKSDEITEHVRNMSPALFALLVLVASLAWVKFRKTVMVTSAYRTNSAMHKAGLAFDARCRDRVAGELNAVEWAWIKERVEVLMPYGVRSDGTVGRSVRLELADYGDHDDPNNDHAHCQVKELM